MSAMDDLAAFWTARLDEAEQVAVMAGGEHEDDHHWHQCDPERAPGKIVTRDGSIVVYDEGWPDVSQAAHIALNDPASVLADVAADRAILARYKRGAEGDLPEWTAGRELIQAGLAILEGVIRDRAARFSSHPDYRESWKP